MIRTIIISVSGADAAAQAAYKNNREGIRSKFASFTYFISKIKKTQVDKVKDLNVLMTMHI